MQKLYLLVVLCLISSPTLADEDNVSLDLGMATASSDAIYGLFSGSISKKDIDIEAGLIFGSGRMFEGVFERHVKTIKKMRIQVGLQYSYFYEARDHFRLDPVYISIENKKHFLLSKISVGRSAYKGYFLAGEAYYRTEGDIFVHNTQINGYNDANVIVDGFNPVVGFGGEVKKTLMDKISLVLSGTYLWAINNPQFELLPNGHMIVRARVEYRVKKRFGLALSGSYASDERGMIFFGNNTALMLTFYP